MTSRFQRITPFLWFDGQAEEAVDHYTSTFENSHIVTKTHYSKDGAKASGQPEGSVMTIAFQLDAQDFVAINGGPHFKFSEAISLVVNCNTQQEIDRYWGRLSAGGDPKAQMCGWLKDRFGLSWQIVPTALSSLMSDPAKGARVMKAILQMKKIDLAEVQRAAA